MNNIDKRINEEIFNEMVGKTLKCIMYDPLFFPNSAYGIVCLNIEDKYYKVSNQIEVEDYFGINEDVAKFDVTKCIKEDIHSYIENRKIHNTPINQLIKNIKVVNENQQLFEDEKKTYDVWITRGFIIELADGLEISFEKEIWFSEEINIEQGHDLIDEFFSTFRITNGWSPPYTMICERKIINYKK